jgi:hypothetical protein
MRKIEQVTVSGQVFPITQIERDLGHGAKEITYLVTLDNGQQKTLRVKYETDIVDALMRSHGIDAEDELVEVAIQEIRMEIFEYMHKVKMVDIIEGRHPELLAEFASHFDVNLLNPEVQEKHIDLIAEAMKEDQ